MKTDVKTTCQNCKKDITDKRLGAKFCSTSCRVNWNNKQKRRLEAKLEQKREEEKKALPNWTLWLIRKRKVLLVYLILIVIIIFQTIGIIRLFQENKDLRNQHQEQQKTTELKKGPF